MKTFKDLTTNTGNNLLIVDSLNLSFRWKHSGALEFCDDYIKTIESFKKSYKASKVILACDKGSSTYRKALYPNYKQNRRDKQALQTEEEASAFQAFFEEFEKTLSTIEKQEKYPLLRFAGVEADDVIAYIVTKRKKLRFDHIWILSSDKDLDLLITDKSSRFSYVTRREITQENWNEHYEFSVEDYISIKCLTGDAGDNVPGVAGIGPKRAAALVAEYGSCWDIIASLPILDARYKYIQQLNKSGELLELNYKLMDLVTHCGEAIGTENIKKINETLELL